MELLLINNFKCYHVYSDPKRFTKWIYIIAYNEDFEPIARLAKLSYN